MRAQSTRTSTSRGALEQRPLEPAELDGAWRERSEHVRVEQLVERVKALPLRRRVLRVGRDHVDALAGFEQLGDAPVERRMVGVDDDLHVVAEALVQVVVHRSADERDPQRVGRRHDDTIRTPVMPPSSRKSAPVVKVVGAER